MSNWLENAVHKALDNAVEASKQAILKEVYRLEKDCSFDAFFHDLDKEITKMSGIPSMYLTKTVDSTATVIDDSVKALPESKEVNHEQ